MRDTAIENRQAWTGAQVWEGRNHEKSNDWFYTFTRADINEIQQALDETRSSAVSRQDLTQESFTLYALGQRFTSLRKDILNGKGFTVLRGLSDTQWNDEDLIRAYWGIGSWFGQPVSQNAQGHLLGHVIDQRQGASAGTRIYQTNQSQSFHSDSCDIVGLLCLRAAKSGGASSIASSPAIHNAMLQSDPDSLRILHDIFYCDRYSEVPEGKLPYYPIRVFNEVNNKFVCCGMDPDIRSAQRLNGVPRLSSKQSHALNTFQTLAEQLSLNMMLSRGDIQLVHNHTVVHARTSFQDHEEPERRRYLIRLWLSSPFGRTLPALMQERWGNIEVGTMRGGIVVPGAVPTVQLKA